MSQPPDLNGLDPTDVIESDFVTLAEICATQLAEAGHAVDFTTEMELVIRFGPDQDAAQVEEIAYSPSSQGRDPRLLTCMEDLVDGEPIDAWVLGFLPKQTFRLRLY